LTDKIIPFRKVGKRNKGPVAIVTEQITSLGAEYLQKYLDFKIKSLARLIPSDCSPNCPFYDGCDHKKEGICQKEEENYTTSLFSYMTAFQIDPTNLSDVLGASELAIIDVLEARCLQILGREGVLGDSIVALADGGKPITEKVGHPAAKVYDTLVKRRTEVLKGLAATREQKKKMELEMVGKRTDAEVMTDILARAKGRVIDAEVVDA
jgi:hypothetical protein